MRISIAKAGAKPYSFEQFTNMPTFVTLMKTVSFEGLCNDLFHLHSRIQRCKWILKHHLHLAP